MPGIHASARPRPTLCDAHGLRTPMYRMKAMAGWYPALASAVPASERVTRL